MRYVRVISLLAVLCALSQAGKVVAQDWIYHAQPGDTLWDLCLEHTARRGCFIELASYNKIVDDKTISPGTEIRIPIAWLLDLPIVGTVINVRGEVDYQEQRGGNILPLREGQSLVLGAEISCKSGSARIALGNHSEILIRRDSVLELTNMSVGAKPGQTTQLQLKEGDVEVQVNSGSRSRFEIHTPSAIAAVRGTNYRVSSHLRGGSESMRSEVLSGLVAVQASSAVEVPAGFGLIAQKGKALEAPRQLLAAPIFGEASLQSPLPLTVRWADDPDAVTWQLDLYAVGDTGALLMSDQSSAPQAQYQQLDLGCYRLVARGIDKDGFNGLESQLPLCVQAPPPAPEPEPKSFWALIVWVAVAVLVLI